MYNPLVMLCIHFHVSVYDNGLMSCIIDPSCHTSVFTRFLCQSRNGTVTSFVTEVLRKFVLCLGTVTSRQCFSTGRTS